MWHVWTCQCSLAKKHHIKIATAEKNVSTRNKRPCEDGPCEAKQPSQQARANKDPVEDGDEDDNGLPSGDFEKTVWYDFVRWMYLINDAYQEAEKYMDAKDLLDMLWDQLKESTHVEFHGTYPVDEDVPIKLKQWTHMIACEIWQLTEYRFMSVYTTWQDKGLQLIDTNSVHDNHWLTGGHWTWFWCSQDEDQKKKLKKSENPEARHCKNVRMKWYPCKSHLTITYKQIKDGSHHIFDNLWHHVKHVLNVDVGMPPPKALQMIEEQAEWLTLAAMASKIQSRYPQVTMKQIHNALKGPSQAYWQHDDEQLLSVKKLLDEYGGDVDIFEPEGVLEGVEMLAWGMKWIAEPLCGKVVEIGMDVACEIMFCPWKKSITEKKT